MAAVTVTSRYNNVAGSLRHNVYTVNIAADTDTLATGMRVIKSVAASSATNNAIGATVSGGTVTFQTGGAETGVLVSVFGQ